MRRPSVPTRDGLESANTASRSKGDCQAAAGNQEAGRCMQTHLKPQHTRLFCDDYDAPLPGFAPSQDVCRMPHASLCSPDSAYAAFRPLACMSRRARARAGHASTTLLAPAARCRRFRHSPQAPSPSSPCFACLRRFARTIPPRHAMPSCRRLVTSRMHLGILAFSRTGKSREG